MSKIRRVVVVTPAGRKRTISILAEYLHRERQIDEWQIWLNTIHQEDINYLLSLRQIDSRFRIIKKEIHHPSNYTIHEFMKDCHQPDTIYIRFDDDIVFIEPGAISRIIQARIEDTESFLIYATLINNGYTSYQYSRMKGFSILPPTDECMDQVSWGDGNFAIELHSRFLETLKQRPESLSEWYLPDQKIRPSFRISINGICWRGIDFHPYLEHRLNSADEEQFFSVDYPNFLKKQNRMLGNALAVHYSFHTQKDILDSTDILEQYRMVMNNFLSR